MYREVAPIWWMNMCWFCFTFYYKQTFTGWFSCCLLVMQRNTYIAAWLCKTVFQVKMQDGENMYYIDKSIIRYCKLWTSSAGTYSLHLVFFIMISHVEVVPLIPNHLDFIGCWVIPGQVITKNGRTLNPSSNDNESEKQHIAIYNPYNSYQQHSVLSLYVLLCDCVWGANSLYKI